MPELTEAQWQSQVEDLLRATNWVWLHVYPLRDRHNRWTTPISGTYIKGWPDICAWRRIGERNWSGVIENKKQKGIIEPRQLEVLKILTTKVDFVWLVRPSDLHDLSKWLATPSVAPAFYVNGGK